VEEPRAGVSAISDDCGEGQHQLDSHHNNDGTPIQFICHDVGFCFDEAREGMNGGLAICHTMLNS